MMPMDSRLKDKHIIIWGIGVLQSDLEGIYEFPDLLYYIDDHVSEENMISVSKDRIYSSEKLAEENLDDIFIILCTEDQEEAISRLKDIGVENDHYMLGEELLIYNSLYQQICTQGIAVWGTGTTYSLCEDKIKRYFPCISCYIVTEKKEEYFQGKKVITPPEIEKNGMDSYIVVASIYYKEIYKELINLGKTPGKDFIHINTLLAACSLTAGVDGECCFEDRKKDAEELLVILAGYKEFVWESVFKRVQSFVPENLDVCVVTSGLVNSQLKQMCDKNHWSYISTSRNNVSMAVNTAIWKHPRAKFIYKMDEDMFLTKGVFEVLKRTYIEVEENGRYEVGFVTPLIPINGYGYVRLLEIFNAVDLWEEKFGKLKYTDNLTHHKNIWGSPEAARFMWGEGNPQMVSLDRMQRILSEREFQYSICPVRYSIGFILFHRDNWIRMGGFPVMVGNMGMDEEALCQFCMMKSRVMVVAENGVAGHLSFGPQNKVMEDYYRIHEEQFFPPVEEI